MGKAGQNVVFLKKPFKYINKERLSKSLKTAFNRLMNKFKRKMETPSYELSLEFRTYDEDEEDTYSVGMSLENIERILHSCTENVETKITTTEDNVREAK